MNVLCTTLGLSWQIVPELLALTNPETVPIYRTHPQADQILAMRETYEIQPVHEFWVITTASDPSAPKDVLPKLREWFERGLDQALIRMVIHHVEGVEDLVSLEQCRRMTEGLFHVVREASERVRRSAGRLYLSLAGGRKTMSSDIQTAGSFFGCDALIHVLLLHEEKGRKIMNLSLEEFWKPWPADLASAVLPVVVGRYPRNPILDLGPDDAPLFSGFGVPSFEDNPLDWNPGWIERTLRIEDPSFSLTRVLEERQRRAVFLAVNHASRLIRQESLPNFLALYSLPPDKVHRLQSVRFGVEPSKEADELAFLQKLPKAELHCHLGGCLHAEDMIQVAETHEEDLKSHRTRLEPWLKAWRRRLDARPLEEVGCSLDAKALRRPVPDVPEPLAVCAFLQLFRHCPEDLDRLLYGSLREPRDFVAVGFAAYERLGDLQGSALLQSEKTLREACRILGRKMRAENVLHLEVRCSPMNYTRGGLRPEDVVRIICESLLESGPESVAVLMIGSRHRRLDALRDHVRLAESLLDAGHPWADVLKGFDLAGDEVACPAAEVREIFLPLMKRCLHATIHAGETAPAESIWEAVYHLGAERIGHGLTLRENPSLMERFRDRRIALEMCPSSNVQIVGFRDAFLPTTAERAQYPLGDYLRQGLRVTVCTDNPGISRTDLSREYHRAARLSPNGLSVWEALLLIRNGFKACFAEAPKRYELLRRAEAMILDLLEKDFPS